MLFLPILPPPRLAGITRYRNNVENDGPESYYKRSVAIPFLDAIIPDIQSRLKDRDHVEIFGLIPSVMLSPSFNMEATLKSLQEKFSSELRNGGLNLSAEIKRWKKLWLEELEKRKDIQKHLQAKVAVAKPNNKTKNDGRRKDADQMDKRADGKKAYQVVEPPDGLLDSLKLADKDFFPNIRRLLIIGCVSPIGSTEAERAASGIRRLKTPYRSTMSGIREGNLNLIQLQRLAEIDIEDVAQIFINDNPRRMFDSSIIYER